MLCNNFVPCPLVLQNPFLVKPKVKFNLEEDHEGAEGEYSFTLAWTSALDRVGGQHRAPATLPRERETVPTV